MSLAIFNMSKSSHATMVMEFKFYEGLTANFTCNTKSIFYMYSLTISSFFEGKHRNVSKGLLLTWLDADM